MKLSFEEYWKMQDQLFHLMITQTDEKVKEQISDLKKRISEDFTTAYPKGFTAKDYKAHKSGKAPIAIEANILKDDQDFIDKARQIDLDKLDEVSVEA